jgi:lipopolysaccharide export LptBFGC system permease protein LptF
MRLSLGGLVVGGRIDRYVGGLFVAAYATSFLLVIGLVLTFHAPFVTVIAGLFTASRLVKNNEIVATLNAGVSAQRTVAVIFAGAAIAAVAMFCLRELVTETLGPRRDALLDRIDNRRTERVFENVWFRDLYNNVVRLSEFRPVTGSPPVAEIRGVEATLEEEGKLVLLRAGRGVWVQSPEGPVWRLEQGVREDVALGSSTSVSKLEGIEFTPRDVLTAIKGQEQPLDLSFSEIEDLARRDPDSTALQTLMQYHLTFPLANLVLLLVALPLMVSQQRGRGMEGLIGGFLLCVLYFAVDFVTRALGMEGDLTPLVASWLPVLLFGSLGVVLFESMAT